MGSKLMCCSYAAVVRTVMILGCVIIINVSANTVVCVICFGGGGSFFSVVEMIYTP